MQRHVVRRRASQREGQSFPARWTRRACAQRVSVELSRVHSLLPFTDVDCPRGARGGTKRRRRLDDRTPACSWCEMSLECSLRELATQFASRRSRRQPKRGGRSRFEPSAPLSAPSHVEGGQLRSRRLSPLLSPSRPLAAALVTVVDCADGRRFSVQLWTIQSGFRGEWRANAGSCHNCPEAVAATRSRAE